MTILPHWRILTIGDGDLTFSASLAIHHKVKHLHSSILDTETLLAEKYPQNGIEALLQRGIPIHFGLDITQPEQFPIALKQNFDLVIFQFPLIPNFSTESHYLQHAELGNNVLNRGLLRQFLLHSFRYFLDPLGRSLAYITSKDVKPYCHWNIEGLVDDANDILFLGSSPFCERDFPDYQVRNVDRDKVIKSTNGTTYVWGRDANARLGLALDMSAKHRAGHCALCGKGPFGSDQERLAHEQSRTHQKLLGFELDWQNALKKGLFSQA